MVALQARFGTLNVHRADCDRKHANPCDPWKTRLPRLVKFIREKMRCSVYAWQECLPEQAIDLTTALGWGTSRNPAYWSDENFNVIAADRKKWTDELIWAYSLSAKPGDIGDRNRRSVLWARLIYLETGQPVWFGSSHLEAGNPGARVLQARELIDTWPASPAALGMDANSYTRSPGQPLDLLAKAGKTLVKPRNPGNERSFHGFGKPVLDGQSIDSIHVGGRGLTVVDAELISTAGLKATDHSGIVASLRVG